MHRTPPLTRAIASFTVLVTSFKCKRWVDLLWGERESTARYTKENAASSRGSYVTACAITDPNEISSR